MARKVRKIKSGGREWKRSMMETILRYAPPMVECKECGRVINARYVCPVCGCDDPGENEVGVDWV